MQVYEQTFRVSETFPINLNEEWDVLEKGQLAERWRVVKCTPKSFTAEITVYRPEE